MNNKQETKIGLALGGGGAKGLAHIHILKAMDNSAHKVSALSGTSIGAIFAAMYATGMSGVEVEAATKSMLDTPKSLREVVSSDRKLGWLELLDFELGRSSLLSAENFLNELQKHIGVNRFEDLSIPLKIVATDYWRREAVVFDSGPLMPAIAASFCIPGIFKPVRFEGRVLVDGGSVNPVPFDLLKDNCDFLVAMDVLAQPDKQPDRLPKLSEAIFQTFQIAEQSIVREKLLSCKPDIYIEAEIEGIKMLDFHKSEKIMAQTAPYAEQLTRELLQKLG